MPTLFNQIYCLVEQDDTLAKTWQRTCMIQHTIVSQLSRNENTEHTIHTLSQAGVFANFSTKSNY